MKKIFALAALLCVAAVSQSHAAPLGFYGALRAGATDPSAMNFAQPSTANVSLNPRTGWALEGALGYHFTDIILTEVTVGYSQHNLSGRFQENVLTIAACGNTASFPCVSPDVTGDTSALDAFAMGYLELPLGALIQPYVGAGIGIVRVDVNAHSRGSLNNGTVSQFDIINADQSVLGYRGKVGLTFPVGLGDVDVAYSYTVTDKLSLPGRGPNVSFTFDQRMKTHGLTAGVTYRF